MLNRRLQPSDSHLRLWTNSTGADVASGALIDLGTGFGVAVTNIANGKVGTVDTGSGVELAKNTGISFVAGEPAFWDAANSRLDKAGVVPGAKCVGVAYESAANAQTVLTVLLNRQAEPPALRAVVSAGQAGLGGGNGQVDFTVPSWVTLQNVIAQVRSSAGALITNYTVTLPAAGTVRLTGGGSGLIPANAVCVLNIVL